MDPQADVDASPRVYKASVLWRAFLGICGGLLTAGGAFGAFYFGTGNEVRGTVHLWIMVGVSAGLALLGISCLAIFRTQLVLTGEALRIPGFFRDKVLKRSDIVGYRMLNVQGVNVLQVHRRDSKKTQISLLFRPDAAFLDWWKDIPDLNAEELAQSVHEVEQDESLGASPEQRVENVNRSRKIARAFFYLTMALGAWAFFYPRPYSLAVTLVALTPWLALGLCWRYRGSFTLEDAGPNTARADLTPDLMLPGFVLALRALLDVQLMHPTDLIFPAVAVTSILTASACAVEPKLRRKPGKLVLLAALLAAYGAGASALANRLLNFERPAAYRTMIVEKRHTTGKHPSHYFKVSGWGPFAEENEVLVHPGRYSEKSKGDSVCILLHSGALGMPFYLVRDETECR